MGSKGDVQRHLTAARTMMHRADEELRELGRLTERLHEPVAARRSRDDVARSYTNWLVDCRQISVSVHHAGQAAGRPERFAIWWEDLKRHEVHRFFSEQRNRALKEVADVIVSKRVVVDEAGRELAYWAFPDGPHAGDPLVPRCQQYTEWLYDNVLATASESLFPWALGD
jgi:hypothetical protein